MTERERAGSSKAREDKSGAVTLPKAIKDLELFLYLNFLPHGQYPRKLPSGEQVIAFLYVTVNPTLQGDAVFRNQHLPPLAV